jgi:hypothetical protein
MTDTKLTKTDRFINLLLTLLKSESYEVDDPELRDILGRPSKSQYHKYLIELTESRPGRPSLIKRRKNGRNYIYELSEEFRLEAPASPKLVLLDNQQNHALVRIYAESRNLFKEARLPASLMSSTNDYDEYKCSYSEEAPFLQIIFAWAEDIEVITPKSLRDQFIQKAQKAAYINMSKDYEKKSA